MTVKTEAAAGGWKLLNIGGHFWLQPVEVKGAEAKRIDAGKNRDDALAKLAWLTGEPA